MPEKRCQPYKGLEGRGTWAVWLKNVSQDGWLLAFGWFEIGQELTRWSPHIGIRFHG